MPLFVCVCTRVLGVDFGFLGVFHMLTHGAMRWVWVDFFGDLH